VSKCGSHNTGQRVKIPISYQLELPIFGESRICTNNLFFQSIDLNEPRPAGLSLMGRSREQTLLRPQMKTNKRSKIKAIGSKNSNSRRNELHRFMFTRKN